MPEKIHQLCGHGMEWNEMAAEWHGGIYTFVGIRIQILSLIAW